MKLIVLLASLLVACSAAPQLLRNTTGLYPRAVVSGNVLLASVVTFDNTGAGVGTIYISNDNGATWSHRSDIVDATGKQGLCCATLYRLPTAVGTLPVGALLWAGSFGQQPSGRRMSLRAWVSTNNGQSWAFHSIIAASPNTGGLWEPEFTIDRQGALVCFYSDETNPAVHSQRLVSVTSRDGHTWSAPVSVVALTPVGARPGMAGVRRLADNTYIMTYEVCGVAGALNCAAHIRTSLDGQNWGSATDAGTLVVGPSGQYFAHTPVIDVRFGSGNGQAVLTGQMLLNQGGSAAPGSGGTLFVNADGVRGVWAAHPAPVPVDKPFDNYCPNYSPALLVLPGGKSVFEITTEVVNNACLPFYGTINL